MQPHHTSNAHTTQKATEEWRDIPGYEGRYQVSNYGRVRSFIRGRKTTYLKARDNGLGYLVCSLSKDGERKRCLVHRLVMLAFVGDSDLDVNHKDGDKTHNWLGNLEYVTHSQNLLHAAHVLGRRFGRPEKLPPTKQDREIRRLAEAGMKQREIAERFGISQPAVSYIVNGKTRPG